jgi:methionyl aminopeptidase
MILIKSGREIDAMRAAGALAGLVREETAKWITPGLTTRQIDEYAADLMKKHGTHSAFLGYHGYPCHVCISVNEQVVHGMASERRIQFGDIVSLDVGVVVNGFVGDTACTVAVGGCDVKAQKLIDVTQQSLYEGISQALPGNRVVDISRAVQKFVESHGFNVVREFVGHGVGRSMHEEPQIPNFVEPGASPRLRAGMTIAIEPMVNAGTADVKILSDGWTVVTQDGQPSAHFEHSVLITDSEPEILTCCENMPLKSKAS